MLLVLLYGVEMMTFFAQTIKCLQACEMWFHRRMLRISWTQKFTNVKVLKLPNAKRMTLEIIKKKKMGYFGFKRSQILSYREKLRVEEDADERNYRD